MKQPRRRRIATPRLEILEEIALLATAAATPPTTSDITQLQQHASSDHTIVFLDNLALVESSRSDVQQYALQDLTTHQTGDLQIEMVAMQNNILLPPNITQPSDQAAAKQVLAALNTANFDKVYLQTIASLESSRATAAQNFVNSTTNTAISTVVQAEIAGNQQAAARANTLLAATSPGGSQTAGYGPLTPTNDAQYIQQAFSTNTSQWFLSQAAALTGANPNLQHYANKLIADHDMSNLQVAQLAASTNQTLVTMLSPLDTAYSRQVLATLNTANFDRTYSGYNAAYHPQVIATDQAELARTTNPNIIAFANNDIATDYLHTTGAQALVSQLQPTPTPTPIRSGFPPVAYLTSLYTTILGTEPDTNGLAFWSYQLGRGVSPQAIQRSFLRTSGRFMTNPFAFGGIGMLYPGQTLGGTV